MEKFCRACLTKQEDPSKLLQYTEKNRRLFAYSTGLQIKNNGASSCQICKHCYIKMMLACRFKKQSRTSDKRLNHYLSLVENGDDTDFATYLKKNDNYFLLKFPLNGSSTPFQKPREDDNESTCTSIRNFMTDMLCEDEVPDTEARIIREMIEQEADVLDDSIDSQWLQDDASVATDFHFSPFSTSRPSKCGSPSDSPIKEEPKEFYFDQESFTAAKRILLKTPSPIDQNNLSISKILDPFQNDGYEIETCVEVKEEDVLGNVCEDNQEATSAGKNVYVEARDIAEILRERDDATTPSEAKDIIDKNIEQALQSSLNEEFCVDALISTPPVQSGAATPLQSSTNKKFPVDALISTPPVQSSVAGASTPLIASILFGDNLNDKTSTAKKHIYCTESVNSEKPDDDVDILQDFFNKETGEYIGEPNEKEQNENFDYDEITSWKVQLGPGRSKYDLSDFSCKLCEKAFGSVRALKIHFFKMHKFKIITPKRIKEPRREVACEICGVVFNRLSNLACHKKRMHSRERTNEKVKCEHCEMEFASKSGFSMHMKTHAGVGEFKAPAEKKVICGICGRHFSREGNLKVHMARHNLDFTYRCDSCGRGFCRRTDLIVHLRKHSGEKPYKCTKCYLAFPRRDLLTLHMKKHTGERPYKCTFCKSSFTIRTKLNHHLINAAKCLRIQEQLQKGDKSPKSIFVKEVAGPTEKIDDAMSNGNHNDANDNHNDANELSTIEEEADTTALENSPNNEVNALPDIKDGENVYDELTVCPAVSPAAVKIFPWELDVFPR